MTRDFDFRGNHLLNLCIFVQHLPREAEECPCTTTKDDVEKVAAGAAEEEKVNTLALNLLLRPLAGHF